MATTSNAFRRKQDAILGIDVSNHTSRPVSQALSRSSTLKSIGGRSVRKIGSIPAEISSISHIPEEGSDSGSDGGEKDSDSARFMDVRRETESIYSRTSHGSGEATQRSASIMSPESERFNPLEDEEVDEDEEYDSLDDDLSIYAGSLVTSKAAAGRRLRAMREANSALRSSSALGFRSSHDNNSSSLPSKAERMLGMSAKPAVGARSAALRPRLSRIEKGVLSAKAQRLLGVGPESFTTKKTKKKLDKGCSGTGMSANRTGSDAEEFKRMLLTGEKGFKFRKGKAESTSDTSSLSRSSLLESQTSRSSRELLSPDSESLTWTASNSTPPPWIGVHPALRGTKGSNEFDSKLSPVSPYALMGRDAGYSGKMVVADFKDMKSGKVAETTPTNNYPVYAVELDAAPSMPAELAASGNELASSSLPDVLATMSVSSAPTSPLFSERPRTSRSDNLQDKDDSLAPEDMSKRKPSRPSAIFDNPNIFEMPADVPISPTSTSTPKQPPDDHRRALAETRSLSSTPPSDRHTRGISPAPPRSPYPPPSKPLPAPPQRRRDSETLVILPPVAFDAGRTRQMSEDEPLSPRSSDPKQLGTKTEKEQTNAKEEKANTSAPVERPINMSLNAQTVPSPLALALAEGRPITKMAPPPLPSPDSQTMEQIAARSEKPRLELSDKDPRKGKAQKKEEEENKKKEVEDSNASEANYRPFSWQSSKTMRSMAADDDAPPMPPPLALTIPTEEIRKGASFIPRAGGGITATPLTATSARSRASRLEKALQSALSKEGMDRALTGERIEDLFKEAGAQEIFTSGIGPRVEGMTEEEDDEDAKQAAIRAQALMKQLGDLQNEVDQLRKLYAPGGPLEGQSPLG